MGDMKRKHFYCVRRLLSLSLILALPYLVISWLRLGSDIDVVGQTGLLDQSGLYLRSDTPGSPQLEICEIPRLNRAVYPLNHNYGRGSSCHRLEPVLGSCATARKLFLSRAPENCNHQTHRRFCHLKQKKFGKYDVKCSQQMCDDDGRQLGQTNIVNGNIEWKTIPSVKELEKAIRRLAEGKAGVRTFGFALVRCVTEEKNEETLTVDDVWDLDEPDVKKDLEGAQVLWFPEHNGYPGNRTGDLQPVSVNVVWLDSVSRHHFFRSLPESVKVLEQINSRPSIKASVLDFRLFQSLKSRTYENLQALFTGEVDFEAEPFGMHDMPSESLRLEQLTKPLRAAGYRTVWLEDLCWHWEWGLPKDLLVYKADADRATLWRDYLTALGRAGIDTVGITTASCQFLDYFGVNDPFHGPDNLCFNGLHQHDYLLGYLQAQQQLFTDYRQPYFSLFLSSLSHEDSGRRVQTIDKALSKYLLFSSKLENTVTIIMSDHGNSYGAFMQKSSEAQVELYNPMLFIITPDKVLQGLGKGKSEALIANQQRLVGVIDLHQTIKALTGVYTAKEALSGVRGREKFDILSKGLLQPVSPNRTCSSLPMLSPNLCICQGYQQPRANNSYYAVLADFALGQLNNEIQRQRRLLNPKASAGFGRCRRLVATQFKNVLITLKNTEDFEAKMELEVPNPRFGRVEVFVVVVQASTNPAHRITLLSFQRVTVYGIFGVCADPGVDLALCVCAIPHNTRETTNPAAMTEAELPSDILQVQPTVTRLTDGDTPDCVYLIYRPQRTGISFEVSNICVEKSFRLELHMRTENTVSSVERWPLVKTLPPGALVHLCVLLQASNQRPWDWSYSVKLWE